MSHRRVAALFAAGLSVGMLYAGLRFGALVAGGSDSYGYVSQAILWRQGLPIVRQSVVRSSPWPRAPDTWAPQSSRCMPRGCRC